MKPVISSIASASVSQQLIGTRNNASQPLRTVSFTGVVALACVCLWELLRLLLWINVGLTQGWVKLNWHDSLSALLGGAWFDAWTLAYLLSPLLLFSALAPAKWARYKVLHAMQWAWLWFIFAALLFGLVAEFVFWQEFTTRFNFIAVDYLIYTKEVIGNIRESYPIPFILSSIAVCAAFGTWIVTRKISFAIEPRSWAQRARLFALSITLPVISFNIANVDQMQLTPNAYANELAGNGLFSLAAAMRRNSLDYDQFYQTIPQAQADATLQGLGVERMPLSKAMADTQPRVSAALANGKGMQGNAGLGNFSRRPKNIVVITVESLSASYVGAYGSKQQLTPNLDRIAAQGLKFEHVYATGTRTVRGLDALTLGAPPIPGQAIIHRPDNEHLATVGEFLEAQGYATFFIYGGYGYFDNMNAYFKANDYQVIDRTDFNAKEIASENVWGVADESLFQHTLTTLDQVQDKPFFAQLMTTSNHRPYTFPDGRIDLPQGSREGAVKYTDYAIGKFLHDAESKPWFKDTLFVIVADHCASVAGKTSLPVEKYHIPVIFYAPDMLKPAHYDRMASQLDIPPTLLDVLGAKGDNHFFGASMFAANNTPSRAFISNYQKLGYYKNDQLIVLSPKQQAESYKVDPVTLESEPAPMDPQLLREAIAYYQTASRAFKQGALKEYADNNYPAGKTLLSSRETRPAKPIY